MSFSLDDIEGDPEQQAEGDDEEIPAEPELTTEEKLLQKQAVVLHQQSEKCNIMLSQATHVLTQAVKLALKLQAMDAISDASIELVKCSAQYDATMASNFLHLHQVSTLPYPNSYQALLFNLKK